MHKLTPYPHQEQALLRMITEPTKSVLLASEQDQGKTLLSIEFALRMKFQRVLFVGIKDTWEQFNERALAQSDGVQNIRRIDSTKQGKANEAALEWGEPGWYFIGQQLFTSRDWTRVPDLDSNGNQKTKDGKLLTIGQRLRAWDSIQLDLLVYDEVHMACAYRSNGAITLHSVHPEWKMAMSGTFFGNKFSGAWAPSYWLWPDIIDASYYRWCAEYVDSTPVVKRNGKPMLDPRGRAIEIELGETPPEGRFVNSLPCYIRHVGDEKVPAPTIIKVDLLPEQRRMYDALEKELLVWIKGHPFAIEFPVTLKGRLITATLAAFEFDPITDSIFFADDAESTKLDALWAQLAEFPEDRVVLGTHSKRFANLTAKRMEARGMKVALWTGDVSSVQRAEIKRQWLADEIQYIVCVIKSFSTGLDWAQTNCWRIGWLSRMDGDHTANDQFVRRVFRTGPNKHKFAHFELQGIGTKDEGVYANYELQHIAQQNTLRSTPVA